MSDATLGHSSSLAGSVAGTIGNVYNLSIQGQTGDIVDVSTWDSTDKWKEKIAGMKDPGTITFSVNYDGSASGVANAIYANFQVSQNWTVTFPDTSTYFVAGFINDNTITAPVGDKITQDVTIVATGVPVFTDVAP